MTSQIARMKHLHTLGFRPRVVLDIGAHEGLWAREAKEAFPGSEVVMFEANDIHENVLKATGFKHIIAVLSNKADQEVEFFSTKDDKFSTGNSVFLENTVHYFPENRKSKTLKTKTLDDVLSQNNIKHNHVDFIKLDVQGSEKSILEGGKKALAAAEFVLMEVQILEYNIGAPMFYDMMKFMDEAGFKMFDLFGAYYLPKSGLLNQMDVLFVKKDSKFVPTENLG